MKFREDTHKLRSVAQQLNDFLSADENEVCEQDSLTAFQKFLTHGKVKDE